MAIAPPQAPATLRITRTLPATRERVFRAWTDPQALARWLAPSDQFSTSVPEFDLRPGGRYRVEMRLADQTHVVGGAYREIRPPEKLVFTWRWENEPAHTVETLVTVELFDRVGSTELVLTHERFADEASRDEHHKGWNGCLERLGHFLEARS
jgi:uncharacterized protein YndB with AHSA1/START domain